MKLKIASSVLLASQLASAQMIGTSRRRLRHGHDDAEVASDEGNYFRHLVEDVSSMSTSMTAIGATTDELASSPAPIRKSTGRSKKSTGRSKKSKKCSLEPIPINEQDFGEPDWEAILELAFPTSNVPENGCPRLDEVGGSLEASFTEFPNIAAGEWNPCYYTKAFAGLNPSKGGYPNPLDTHYPYEFGAPFFGQPGDGSVHHCADGADTEQDIGACPKLGADCGPDCAKITDEYGIGHVPPFVPLAAIKNAYGKCGKADICENWFHFETSGCNIQKSSLDKLVYEYFGDGDTIRFQPPILLDGEPSNTYFRLEYGGEPACDDEINVKCKGPHYCSKEVGESAAWGDFCPYVHTGENSGKYRHPHLALAALELWIANQCMPDKCASKWLESPNGNDYAADPLTSTSITWTMMDNENFPIAQPAVPYLWPNEGGGLFPGLKTLYGDSRDCTSKDAPGLFVTDFAGVGPGCAKPSTVFDTICTAFDQCYTALNEGYIPSCFCSEENDTYQDATCYDQVQRCINVPPDSDEICAYGIGTHRYQDNQFIGSWSGYEFDVDGTGNGGTSTLLDIWLPFPAPEVSDACFLEVNSNVCTSCTWTLCNGSLAFVADCSNAGFDGDIDSCDGSAPWAGFNFLFDVPEFHLDCMPSDQPGR